MAKKIIAEDITSNLILSNGKEVLKQNFTRREYEDGEIEGNETIAEHIEGSDSIINFAQLSQGKSLGRCYVCTKQSQRIFFRRNIIPFSFNIRNCFFCRKSLCIRHSHVHSNQIVCTRCLILQKYIKPIFFRKVSP